MIMRSIKFDFACWSLVLTANNYGEIQVEIPNLTADVIFRIQDATDIDQVRDAWESAVRQSRRRQWSSREFLQFDAAVKLLNPANN